jgi:DNA polymerase-3 subunit gamma/tau
VAVEPDEPPPPEPPDYDEPDPIPDAPRQDSASDMLRLLTDKLGARQIDQPR